MQHYLFNHKWNWLDSYQELTNILKIVFTLHFTATSGTEWIMILNHLDVSQQKWLDLVCGREVTYLWWQQFFQKLGITFGYGYIVSIKKKVNMFRFILCSEYSETLQHKPTFSLLLDVHHFPNIKVSDVTVIVTLNSCSSSVLLPKILFISLFLI